MIWLLPFLWCSHTLTPPLPLQGSLPSQRSRYHSSRNSVKWLFKVHNTESRVSLLFYTLLALVRTSHWSVVPHPFVKTAVPCLIRAQLSHTTSYTNSSAFIIWLSRVIAMYLREFCACHFLFLFQSALSASPPELHIFFIHILFVHLVSNSPTAFTIASGSCLHYHFE